MLKKLLITGIAAAGIVAVSYVVVVSLTKKPASSLSTEAIRVQPPSSEAAATLPIQPTESPTPTVEKEPIPSPAEKMKTTKKTAEPAAQETVPLITSPAASMAAISPPSQGATIQETTAGPGEKRGAEASLLVGHLAALKNGERSFTEVVAEVGYRFTNRSKIAIGQEVKKLYDIAEYAGEKEVVFDDTTLFYQYNIAEDTQSLGATLEAGATLPVSKYSRDMKHITRPYLSLELKRALFGDRVTLSVSPALEYYFNSWATSPAWEPLRRMALGTGAEIRWTLLPGRLSWSIWGKGFYRIYEEYDTAALTPDPTTDFALGSCFDIQIVKNVAAQVGFARGNTLARNVRYESNFYDSITNRIYAAIAISL